MFLRILVMRKRPQPEAQRLAKLYEETEDEFYYRTLAHIILDRAFPKVEIHG